jgi:hypothetical protein
MNGPEDSVQLAGEEFVDYLSIIERYGLPV